MKSDTSKNQMKMCNTSCSNGHMLVWVSGHGIKDLLSITVNRGLRQTTEASTVEQKKLLRRISVLLNRHGLSDTKGKVKPTPQDPSEHSGPRERY